MTAVPRCYIIRGKWTRSANGSCWSATGPRPVTRATRRRAWTPANEEPAGKTQERISPPSCATTTTWPGRNWGFSLPAERKFGDLSTTLAFALAKKAKGKPFLLADDIAAKLQGRLAEVEEIRVAGGGFLNFYLRRDDFLLTQWRNLAKPPARRQGAEKVIVEHTSINPNKSAHIGHLRNSCLGDVLARCCRFLGYEVEVQNYIDDTGIQIADVVWGLLHYQKNDLAAIRKIPDLAAYLWDLYAEVNRLFADDEALAAQRREVHKKIEDKVDPEYGACLLCRRAGPARPYPHHGSASASSTTCWPGRATSSPSIFSRRRPPS